VPNRPPRPNCSSAHTSTLVRPVPGRYDIMICCGATSCAVPAWRPASTAARRNRLLEHYLHRPSRRCASFLDPNRSSSIETARLRYSKDDRCGGSLQWFRGGTRQLSASWSPRPRYATGPHRGNSPGREGPLFEDGTLPRATQTQTVALRASIDSATGSASYALDRKPLGLGFEVGDNDARG